MILKLDQHYQVKIIEILKNGVVAKLEDGETTFIHISKLASTYIHDISKAVKLNDVYDAIGVVGKDRDVELSLVHLDTALNLDEMIKSANAALEDKMEHKKFSRPGKNRRRNLYVTLQSFN